MKKLYLLLYFATAAQSCLAGSSLSEELAAERGIKLVSVDLLGKSRSAQVKPQIMSCNGTPATDKTANAEVLQNKDGKMVSGNGQPVPAQEFDLEKTKESLMDVSRQAANSRYRAAMAQGKKRSCNVNLTE